MTSIDGRFAGSAPASRGKLWTGRILSGLGAAFMLVRVLTKMLYGVSPRDPVMFAAAAAVVLLVAGLANYLPARRAARTDPLSALRAE